MGCIRSTLAVIALLGGFTVPFHTFAAGTLSGDEVRKLIVGNTVYAEVPSNGKKFKNYFDPSGKFIREEGGKVFEGSYSISDDGAQCVKAGSADYCAKIANNGDGTYSRVSAEGEVLVKWHKIVNGKDIK